MEVRQPEAFVRRAVETGRRDLSAECWRARVEADISRLRQVIGGTVRSRADRRRTTEVSIAVSVLNRVLELGRPAYVRLRPHRMSEEGDRPSWPQQPTHATQSRGV